MAISFSSYIDPAAEARVARPCISAPIDPKVSAELDRYKAVTKNSPESCGCLALENCPCVASVSLDWEPGRGKPGSLSLKLAPGAAVDLSEFAIAEASQSYPPVFLDGGDLRNIIDLLGGGGKRLSLVIDKDGNVVLYDIEKGQFFFKVNVIATENNLARSIDISNPEVFSAERAQIVQTEKRQEENAAKVNKFWESVKEYAKIGGGGIVAVIVLYFGLGLLHGGKKMTFGEALEAYADQEERQARREMKNAIRKGYIDAPTATALCAGRLNERDLIRQAGEAVRKEALARPSPPKPAGGDVGEIREIPGTGCWQNTRNGQVVGPHIVSYMGVGIGRDLKAENQILKGIELDRIEDTYRFDSRLWRNPEAGYRQARNIIVANPLFSREEQEVLLDHYAERSGVKK